jgi:sigma-B regulation protein RsbU (phosphoserine phosphatase)
MPDLSKSIPFSLLGEADPLPENLWSTGPEQAKTLDLLYEVSREITSILDRQELLSRIAQLVKKLVNYHVFTVMLWDENKQHLESVFAMRYENSIPERYRMPLHRGITGIAAGERRTMRIGDVRQDDRYVQCEQGVEVRSELVIPLLLQDRLVGVLDLESTEPHSFTAEHERMLTLLGSYISIALENARLYEFARENERRLQADLETAREIQKQLLPTGAREIPGLDLATAYVPARELGGDFYDFLPYGEGRLAIALGDVSGKGTAAALYGSLAIGTMRELVVEHAQAPAQMLRTLNERLRSARLDARFIAMTFAVFDGPTRRLTIASAGSPYPLLVRDGAVQELLLTGVPLGLLSNIEYDEISVDLRPGDVVLFASDGIQEAQNAAEEEFGIERLMALLSSVSTSDPGYQIAQKIVHATDQHSGPGVFPHDDRTILVLRVTHETSTDFSKLPIIY